MQEGVGDFLQSGYLTAQQAQRELKLVKPTSLQFGLRLCSMTGYHAGAIAREGMSRGLNQEGVPMMPLPSESGANATCRTARLASKQLPARTLQLSPNHLFNPQTRGAPEPHEAPKVLQEVPQPHSRAASCFWEAGLLRSAVRRLLPARASVTSPGARSFGI